MKKGTSIIIMVVVIAVVLGGVYVLTRGTEEDANSANSTSTAPTTQTETQSEAGQPSIEASQIEIKDLAFQPRSVTIKKGTTVTWTNRDTVEHDVAPDDGDSEAFKGSELLAKDESYSFTFNTPGIYTYHCSPHPHMTGTVTVTE